VSAGRFAEDYLPAADLVALVSVAHVAKIAQIVPQRVAFAAAHVVVVNDVLNVADGVIQIVQIEPPLIVPLSANSLSLPSA